VISENQNVIMSIVKITSENRPGSVPAFVSSANEFLALKCKSFCFEGLHIRPRIAGALMARSNGTLRIYA
jgi:hypothetical protein